MVLIPFLYLSDHCSPWTDTPNSSANKHHEGAEEGGSLTSHRGTSYHTKYDQQSGAISLENNMQHANVLQLCSNSELSVTAVQLFKNYPDSS